ncbi:DUF4153 domain-containing protein [Fusibacter sp. JL298sf-3]
MKKLFGAIRDKLVHAGRRFPQTVFVALATTVLMLVMPRVPSDASAHEIIGRLVAIGWLLIPMTLFVLVYAERAAFQPRKKALYLAGAAVIATVFVYPAKLTEFYWLQYAGLMIITAILFTLVPYFPKKEGLSHYVFQLLAGVAETLMFSGFLYLGIAGIIGSIDVLFEVNIDGELYFDAFKIIFGTFAVVYFIGVIPDRSTFFTPADDSTLFKKLLTHIVMPILVVYAVILHAYFIKVLLDRQMPQGVVGHLVLWYAVVSMVTLFFIKNHAHTSAWVRRFSKTYSFALIIPVAMFFSAMAIRVGTYGFTVPRTFGFLLGVYTTLVLLLMQLSKKDIGVLCVALSIPIVLIGLFGPLSAYRVSLRSQEARLETMLEDYGLWTESGGLVPNGALTVDEKYAIERQVSYLVDAYGADRIDVLPDDFTYEKAPELFGFEFFKGWGRDWTYFNVEALQNRDKLIDVRSADYLMHVRAYEREMTLALEDGYAFAFKPDESVVVLTQDGAEKAHIDFEALAQEVKAAPEEPLEKTVPYRKGNLVLTFYFTDLNGEIGTQGDLRLGYYEAYIAIRVAP